MEGGWWLLAHAHRQEARGAAYLGVARSQPSWCGEGLSLCASAVPQQCFSLLDCLLGCGGSMAIGSFKFIPTLSAWQPSPKRLPFSNRKMREIPCSLALAWSTACSCPFHRGQGKRVFGPAVARGWSHLCPNHMRKSFPQGRRLSLGEWDWGVHDCVRWQQWLPWQQWED